MSLRPILLLATALVLVSGIAAEEAPPPPPYPLQSAVLDNPAAAGATSPVLVTGPEGTVAMAWVKAAAGGPRLGFARFDAAAGRWGSPHAVNADPAATAVSAPQLAVGESSALALAWIETAADGATHARYIRSDDAGTTWSQPEPLDATDVPVTGIAIAFAGDQLLAAVLGSAHEDRAVYLRAGAAGGNLANIIDDSASPGSAPAFTVFPNGNALLAYRGQSDDHAHDIHIAGWAEKAWSPGKLLTDDDWRVPAPPATGPRLASAGGMAAAVWFTAAGRSPRIELSTTPDAGQRWLMPQRLEVAAPAGRPATLMLRDGSVIAAWREGGAEPGIYLRRVATDGELYAAVRLAITRADNTGASPVLALLKDYDQTPAEVLVAYALAGEGAGVKTLRLALPPLSALAKRAPCIPCDEKDALATRGYAVKGVVTKVLLKQGLVMIRHEEIPGVMRAMTMAFRADLAALKNLRAGQEILGRMERRDRDWWVFNVRLVGDGAPAKDGPP